MNQGIEIPRPTRKRAPTTGDPGRRRLKQALLDELTSHSPADMLRYMRRWPSGPLSLVHLQVLTVLETEGPVPMGALADSLDVSQASATGIVDRMEQRGLIERRRDDEDRRVIRVALTEAGTRLLAGVAADRRERLGFLLDELSDDELEGFLRGSRALREARRRLAPRWAVPEVQPPKPSKTPVEASR